MTTHSSLASVQATRNRLEELGLSTKKSLGQHFLIDDGIVGRILRLASVEPGSSLVEVGPGIGTLTEALLASKAEVTAVELDHALLEGLIARYPHLHLIEGDALSPATIAQLQHLAPEALVANLPYAVAATIILEYFQQLPSMQSATVMVQREVAERIMAEPDSKDYGSYTVKLRLLACARESFKVSPQCFYPPPRVDSMVIRLERVLKQPVCQVASPCGSSEGVLLLNNKGDGSCAENSDEPQSVPQDFTPLIMIASMLADAAFYQRRKTIRNSMRAFFEDRSLDKTVVDLLLSAAGVNPGSRGETLQPHVYLLMAEALMQRSA